MVGVSLGKVECEHFKTGASKTFPDGNCPKDLREWECRKDICPKKKNPEEGFLKGEDGTTPTLGAMDSPDIRHTWTGKYSDTYCEFVFVHFSDILLGSRKDEAYWSLPQLL